MIKPTPCPKMAWNFPRTSIFVRCLQASYPKARTDYVQMISVPPCGPNNGTGLRALDYSAGSDSKLSVPQKIYKVPLQYLPANDFADLRGLKNGHFVEGFNTKAWYLLTIAS